jgi:hypothetical protein
MQCCSLLCNLLSLYKCGWLPTDSHCHDTVTILHIAFFLRKAINTVFVGKWHCTALWLWVNAISEPSDYPKCIPKLFDVLMIHNSKMPIWACCVSFHWYWHWKLPLQRDVTIQTIDCQKGKIKYCLCSVDTHNTGTLPVIQCSTIILSIHTVIIDRQCNVSIRNHLHRKALSVSQFLSDHLIQHLSDQWHRPITNQVYHLAICDLFIYTLVLGLYSVSYTPILI